MASRPISRMIELSRIYWSPKDKDHLKRISQTIYWYQCKELTFNGDYIGDASRTFARTIKESIYIRLNNSTFNWNVGKYNLYHIWDRVLFNTPDLKINNYNEHAHRTSFSGHTQFILTNRHVQGSIGHTEHAQSTEHVHRTY